MRTICATVVTFLLATPQLFADGPMTRSITAEATRLAVQRGEEGQDLSRWRDVSRLETGQEIVLTTLTRESRPVFVTADDSSIVVLHPSWLPSEAGRQLIAAAVSNPGPMTLAVSGGAKAINDFVIGPDGVFFRGAKLAERSNVIERVAAGDVVSVSLPLGRRGSAGAAAAGVAMGLFGSLIVARNVGVPETWSGVTILLVGLPAAAGFGAWYANSEMTERVIYRASTRP